MTEMAGTMYWKRIENYQEWILKNFSEFNMENTETPMTIKGDGGRR